MCMPQLGETKFLCFFDKKGCHVGLIKINFKSNGHRYVGNMLCKISYCVCHLSNQSLSFKPPTFFFEQFILKHYVHATGW